MSKWQSLILIAFCSFGAGSIYAQSTTNDPPMGIPTPALGEPDEREDLPKSLREMRMRQRRDRETKQHNEMLKRGETAAKLAEDLYTAIEKKEQLSATDRKKLDDLEKLITRIRKDLGGSNDGLSLEEDEDVERPTSISQAVLFLKDATEDLLKELKKTTRFTISAVAIRSSNSVIRIARFLKLRR